jgi:hypothetical protein
VDFVAVLDQVITLLRQRGRLTYSTLKRQFQLDDAALEDVKTNASRTNTSRSMSGATLSSGRVTRGQLPPGPPPQSTYRSGLPSATRLPIWPRRS